MGPKDSQESSRVGERKGEAVVEEEGRVCGGGGGRRWGRVGGGGS